MTFHRLDAIKKVEIGSVEQHYNTYLGCHEKFDQHLWGVSMSPKHKLDHIEMTIHHGPGEDHILQRLNREKRHGHIEIIDEHTCKFVADVYDASEMLPWLRTFIGRIIDLQCSSQFVLTTFYEDLNRMNTMYGGDKNAVQ